MWCGVAGDGRTNNLVTVDVAATLDTDYYVLDEFLMDEDSEVRNRVRAFAVASSSRLLTSTATRHS
jgi:hypothetical protein